MGISATRNTRSPKTLGTRPKAKSPPPTSDAAPLVGESSCVLTRRSVVFGGLGALTACSRPKATGFSGYAFIANRDGGAVAAVDLEVFAVARHIPVDGAPTAVVAREKRARVYALTPENGSVHEIRAGNLTFAHKLQVASAAITMRLSPSGRNLYVLCREPRKLVALAFEPMRVDWELPLPADPTDFA